VLPAGGTRGIPQPQAHGGPVLAATAPTAPVPPASPAPPPPGVEGAPE